MSDLSEAKSLHRFVKNANKEKEGHPGFKKVQGKIEKEGYSKEEAGAILASKARGASAGAKKANPKLKKVKG